MEKSYTDITKRFKKIVLSASVKSRNYVKVGDEIFKVNPCNEKVIFNPSKNEINIAIWLKNTLGGKIFLNPKVLKPHNKKTSDYMYRNRRWELKTLGPKTKSKFAVNNRIFKARGQANNFIIDISTSSLSFKKGLEQLNFVYNNPDLKWVDKIILKKNTQYIVVKRKK